MIQRISEIEGEPIVGTYYLVPMVWQMPFMSWRAVIGSPHDDIDHFDFKLVHYHYDFRFFTDEQFNEIRVIWGRMDATPGQLMTAVCGTNQILAEPVWKRRKCRRRMPDLILKAIENFSTQRWRKFEEFYSKEKLSCLRCPHRGMSLKGLPVKDDVVICNGHGLAWNIKTGEMVGRLSDI